MITYRKLWQNLIDSDMLVGHSPEVLIPVLRKCYPDVGKAMVMLKGKGNPKEISDWMKIYGHMKDGVNTSKFCGTCGKTKFESPYCSDAYHIDMI